MCYDLWTIKVNCKVPGCTQEPSRQPWKRYYKAVLCDCPVDEGGIRQQSPEPKVACDLLEPCRQHADYEALKHPALRKQDSNETLRPCKNDNPDCRRKLPHLEVMDCWVDAAQHRWDVAQGSLQTPGDSRIRPGLQYSPERSRSRSSSSSSSTGTKNPERPKWPEFFKRKVRKIRDNLAEH